jgi:hypothetical protein
MNIVGSNALVKFPDVYIEQWNKIFEINVTGTLRGIQTCAPLIMDTFRLTRSLTLFRYLSADRPR